MIYTENMLSLFPNRFRIYHSGMWIKRESGVNPGQSRCCETTDKIYRICTYCHCLTPHNENAGRHRK